MDGDFSALLKRQVDSDSTKGFFWFIFRKVPPVRDLGLREYRYKPWEPILPRECPL